jgi:ATP-binding cassette subfamily B protein
MQYLKKFVSYYKYEWKLFLIDLVCAGLLAGIDLLFPIATRMFMKDLIPNRQLQTMIYFIAALVVLYIIRLLLQFIVDYWGHVVGVSMEYHMRKDLFSHLQTLDYAFYDNAKVGHLMSRIVNDLRDVTELAHHGPEDLFIACFMLVGSFLYLSRINLQLTLMAFFFIPIMVWLGISKRSDLAKAFKAEREKIADVNADLENSLSGIRVVKSFTNEEYELERFNLSNNFFQQARKEAFKVLGQYSAGLNFLSNLVNVSVLAAGGLYVYLGRIDLADLTTYLMFIGFFLQPIHRLIAFSQQYQQGMSGFVRFVELIQIKPSISDRENAIPLEKAEGNIKIQNVSFHYRDSDQVLDNINLQISAGTTIALVGPSGGGKTTLCHLIPRFYDPTEGSILLDGIDIRDIKLSSLRRHIGLVQQDIFLFTGSIKDNIRYGKLDATDEEIMEAAKKADIHEFVMSLPDKYDTYIGERGIKLSGGQKQRVAIARVFLKNPPILILDEATSALDTATELQIQQALNDLSKNRTTIVIAHRLSTIKNADRIIVIDDGRILEQGTHEELLKSNGIYAKLYQAQFTENPS